MATELNYPGTFLNDGLSGGNWVNMSNVSADDASEAYVGLGSGNAQSKNLKCTNFGFSIPTGATIDGVLLEYQGRTGGWTAHDLNIQLVVSDARTGNVKSGNNFTTTNTNFNHGGASDTWGISLSDSDVNDSTFGVSLSFERSYFSLTLYLDYVRLTVYYTEAGTEYNESITLSAVAAMAKSSLIEAESSIALSAVAIHSDAPDGEIDETITLPGVATMNTSSTVASLVVGSEKRNPGTTRGSGSGDTEWQDTDYAQISDNRRTWCDIFQPNTQSNYLEGYNFGFEIPSGAAIEGVEVTVEHRAQPADDIEISVQLMVDYIADGNTEDDFSQWPYNDTTTTFGSDSSVWGLSLTSQIINSSGFGFRLYIIGASGPSIPAIDNVYITVYYTSSGNDTADDEAQFATSAALEFVSDLGGSTYEESLSFSARAGFSASVIQNVNSAITLNSVAILDVVNDKEQIGIKLILDDATVKSIDLKYVFNLKETVESEFQLITYQDESCRVYGTGGESRVFELVLRQNTDLRDLLAALRTEVGNIRLYYNYNSDKSESAIVRIHPLIPLDYVHGGMDADKFLRAIFYEQIT